MKSRGTGRPRLLGVLLCFNDGDLVREAVRHLLDADHDVIVWDHGSNDETPLVLHDMQPDLVELTTVPRTVDFYDIYRLMSDHLLRHYVERYDWISWPDQDEFLEGPDRTRPYRNWIEHAVQSEYDWIEFNNYTFWWTVDDDPSIESPVRRVRHYSLFPDCSPRIRSWRASCTNLREFNHNPPLGQPHRLRFNLRHYPMRSEAQMLRRIEVDRADLRRGSSNYHYDNMRAWPQRLRIAPEQLHVDNGGELDSAVIFDWREVYGYEDSRLSN
jgi:hypothetical protein